MLIKTLLHCPTAVSCCSTYHWINGREDCIPRHVERERKMEMKGKEKRPSLHNPICLSICTPICLCYFSDTRRSNSKTADWVLPVTLSPSRDTSTSRAKPATALIISFRKGFLSTEKLSFWEKPAKHSKRKPFQNNLKELYCRSAQSEIVGAEPNRCNVTPRMLAV